MNKAQAVSPGDLKLPDIPSGVLGLLGISGGSYVLSKGIQKTAEVANKQAAHGQAQSGGAAQAGSGNNPPKPNAG